MGESRYLKKETTDSKQFENEDKLKKPACNNPISERNKQNRIENTVKKKKRKQVANKNDLQNEDNPRKQTTKKIFENDGKLKNQMRNKVRIYRL